MEGRRRRRAIDRDDVHAGQHLVEALPIGRLQLVLDATAARGGGCGSGSTGRRPWRGGRPRCRCGPCRRCRAACPRCGGRASRSATSRPICSSPVRMLAPSVSRRGTASISAMVMSAVSSVSTFGVLVTVMPRLRGGLDVDLVDAVAEIGDQLEVVAGLRDQRGVDAVGDGRHQHVGFLDRGHQFRLASSAGRRHSAARRTARACASRPDRAACA